ncbi:MAG TPA: two-component regulator propeller domain-containing protein, partial [Saprospiraceae bacterium]
MNRRFISFMILLATGFLSATPYYLWAQQLIRQGDPIVLSIKEIGVADGLSQGMIHGLDVDLKGYLWIGTKDGLNRYDGNHFHVFRHEPKDTTSIASNYIISLHVDDRGLIWIGTNASGLDLYNPTKEEFIHFGSGYKATSRSRIQSVSKIYSSPDGTILVWDGTGAQCEILEPIPGKDPFDPNSWKVKSFEEVYQLPHGMPNLGFYNMLGFGADGAILCVHNQKVYALYADQEKVMYPSSYNLKDIAGSLSNSNAFTYFLGDYHDLYCVGHLERLLYKWDKQSDSFQPWIQLPDDFILGNRFFVDHQNRLWSNGTFGPLIRSDPQLGLFQKANFTRYHFTGTQPTDFSVLCEDPQHNLWAATGGNGFIKISSRNDQFTRQYTKYQFNLSNRLVKNGTSFNIDDQFTADDDQKIRDRIVEAGMMATTPYAEDSLHQLWCIALDSISDEYLVKINKDDHSFSCQRVYVSNQVRYEFESTIMIDRTGMIWMGVECFGGEAQLIRLNKISGTQDKYVFPIEVIRNEHTFITDWYVDPQNIFWLATKQGLFSFNPATGAWKTFQVDHTREDALSNIHVLTICPDPKEPAKYLWIGTDGGGLNKLNISTGTFKHYNTSNGIPNNVIYAVQSDAHNNLWLSTNLGLCRFDPGSEEVWSFTIEDGLPGNEFNRMEYGKGSDGRLYFAGVEGVISFDPEDFYRTSTSSPIVINRLKLSNKEVRYSAGISGELKGDYHLSAPLELSQQL